MRAARCPNKYRPTFPLNPTVNSKLISEVFDTQKVQVVCRKHNYVGSKKPPASTGCRDCWYAYYVWDLATTPPNLRQERLDELESVILHAAEFAQKGKFGNDLELYAPGDERFQIKIDKDAE